MKGEFNEADIKNGLPEFYLRSDEDIFSEVIQNVDIEFNWDWNVWYTHPGRTFEEHRAHPKSRDNWVPKNYQDRCWEVFNRIIRLCEIRNAKERLIFWGLKEDEAAALSKIECVDEITVRWHSNGFALTEKNLADFFF